jgi:hypothetical protein
MTIGNYIYVIRYRERDHKIGFSIRPERRLKQLQCDGYVLRLVRAWHRPSGDAPRVESIAHRIVRQWQYELGGERERFELSETAACLAVDLAAQIADDEATPCVQEPLPAVEYPPVTPAIRRPERLEEYGPPADLAPPMYGPPMPPLPLKIGYAQRSVPGALERDKDILVAFGVEPARIYSELGSSPGEAFRHAVKACRDGDTLVIVQPKHFTDEAEVRLRNKGATIVRAAA